MREPIAEARLGAARLASQAVFAASGLLVASWASRIPQVSTHLRLTPGQLGFVLFTQAAGGLLAAPIAGVLVARLGVRRATVVSGIALGGGLIIVARGSASSIGVLVAGLTVLGAGIGLGDVAMSVHVAGLEHRSGATLLPRAYGWFGLGGLSGAALGTACTAVHIPPPIHLAIVGVLGGLAITAAGTVYLDGSTTHRTLPLRGPGRRTRRPAVGAMAGLGAIAATFALAEGAGSNWIGVSLVQDRGSSAVIAATAYGCFVTAATVARFVLPRLLHSWQRSTVLCASALTVLVAVVLFVAASGTGAATAAAVLWGAGGALGIPTTLQLAGERGDAAARIAVVTTCMYIAYLAGPPLIGLLGEVVPVPVALLAVLPPLGVTALLASRLRHQPAPTTLSLIKERP